jgi:hypothetical protein
VSDVLGREDLGHLGLQDPQLVELVEVVHLVGLDAAVLVLVQDEQVEHPDGPGLGQRCQLGRHLAGEVAAARGELHDEVVHRSQLVDRCVAHRGAPLRTPKRRTSHCRPSRRRCRHPEEVSGESLVVMAEPRRLP